MISVPPNALAGFNATDATVGIAEIVRASFAELR